MNSPLQGYDQVVAISQDMINGSLQNFTGPSSNFSSLSFTTPDKLSSIEANLDFLTLLLSIPGQGPQKCRLILPLLSGRFAFTAQGDSSKTFSVNNWTLAFTVDLTPATIANLSPAVAKTSIVPERYDILQIFTILTTAELLEFDISSSSVAGLPKVNQPWLTKCLNAYLSGIRSTTHYILGWVPINAPTPKSITTYPPTSITFQIMPYANADDTPSPGNDVLLFLCMFANAAFPQTFLDRNAAWLECTGSEGIMSISCRHIWDNYLANKMTHVNLVAVKSLNSAWHWLSNLRHGVPFTKDTQAWCLSDTNDIQVNPLPWTRSPTEKGTWGWGADSGLKVAAEWNGIWKISATVSINLGATPPSRVFRITSTSYARIVKDQSKPPYSTPLIVTATYGWNMYMTPNAVVNGILYFECPENSQESYEMQNLEATTTETPCVGASSTTDQTPLNASESMVAQLGTVTASKNVVDAMNNAPFIFPGSDKLEFKGPRLNSTADIVVNIGFNGA